MNIRDVSEVARDVVSAHYPDGSPESVTLLSTQVEWKMRDLVVETIEECAKVAEELGQAAVAIELRFRSKKYEVTP